jgi:PBP1b-binding outer membrane lipoprotein LpoB
MRRTISGAAIAVLASATLLAGCADDTATEDPAVEDTTEDMATMEPTDG